MDYMLTSNRTEDPNLYPSFEEHYLEPPRWSSNCLWHFIPKLMTKKSESKKYCSNICSIPSIVIRNIRYCICHLLILHTTIVFMCQFNKCDSLAIMAVIQNLIYSMFENGLFICWRISIKMITTKFWSFTSTKHNVDTRFLQTSKGKPTLLKVEDKVWLLRRMNTNRPCDKLNYQTLGSFSINKQSNEVI